MDAEVESQTINDATSDAVGRPRSAWSAAGVVGGIVGVITLAIDGRWG